MLSACGGGIKLIDFPKSSAALNLSKAQQAAIEPKIALLRNIVEDYEFERDEVKAEYHRYQSRASLPPVSRNEGGRLGRGVRRERHELRTKLRSFAMQRRVYAKEISGLIGEIKANLTSDQRVVFQDIKLPELKLPDILRRRSYDEFGRIPGMRVRGRPDDF